MTNPASRWVATDYAANAGFVPALGGPVLDLLSPSAGERILDLGCGDGILTAKIVDAGAEVLGVDASEDMIAAAKARGAHLRCRVRCRLLERGAALDA
jgi:2-polyprenyl-3-methyl-5-hydroxy-6-metoxy-1,4-benzoquinol methylase